MLFTYYGFAKCSPPLMHDHCLRRESACADIHTAEHLLDSRDPPARFSRAPQTESCKRILHYLTHVAASASTSARRRTERLARQLHATNPLLEAFGNAKTLRNDNSSRFGKFIRLHFSLAGALSHAQVERYLLEKSRVTSVDTGERSFHVLYQLCAGAPEALRQRLHLPHPDVAAASFLALARGECLEIAGVDDALEFDELCTALRSLTEEADPAAKAKAHAALKKEVGAAARLGRSNGEECLWSCTAALLHLCNVVFVADDDDGRRSGAGGAGGGGAPAARIADVGDAGEEEAGAGEESEEDTDDDEEEDKEEGEGARSSRSRTALAHAAELWQVEVGALEKALTRRTIVAGSELCELRKNVAEASASRDALAKATYERLFDALLGLTNMQLAGGGGHGGDSSGGGGGAARGRMGHPSEPAAAGGFIGLLDIFGSEVFESNGFEQLLINFANERLQQLFTATAIQRVQAEYQSEGLPWERIEYTDNAPVLMLLEGKPTSILSALDDQGLIAGSTDDSFIALLHASFGEHPAFGAPRFGSEHARFVIHHYASSVTYSGASGGFLLKNKDSVYTELPHLMRTSALPFVRELFTESRVAAATSRADGPAAAAAAAAGRSRRRSKSPGPAGGAAPRQQPRTSQYVSVSAQFRDSMAQLASTLGSTSCHFIRCIKPNETRSAFTLVPDVALAQLRSCGVLEAVRVSQAGYPTRMPFADLVSRYAILIPAELMHLTRKQTRIGAAVGGSSGGLGGSSGGLGGASLEVLRSQASALLNSLPLGGEAAYMLGRTMVFLRSGVLAKCELARTHALDRSIAVCQAMFRRNRAVARFAAARRAVAQLQAAIRCFVLRAEGRRLLARMRRERKERERAAEEHRRKLEAEDADALAAEQAARRAEAEAAEAAAVGAEEAEAAEVAAQQSKREAALIEAAAAAAEEVSELSSQLAAATAQREAAEAKVLERQEAAEGRAEEARAEAARRAEAEARLGAIEARAEAQATGLAQERAESDRLAAELTEARGALEVQSEAMEGSVASIMALAWAQSELESVRRELETSREETAAAVHETAELREEIAEQLDDLDDVQGERSTLEELNYSMEAQLEEYESVIERQEDELHSAANELAVTKVALTEAKEESLRLMNEVAWLRGRLAERDEELRRAAETNVALVERWSTSEQAMHHNRQQTRPSLLAEASLPSVSQLQ